MKKLENENEFGIAPYNSEFATYLYNRYGFYNSSYCDFLPFRGDKISILNHFKKIINVLGLKGFELVTNNFPGVYGMILRGNGIYLKYEPHNGQISFFFQEDKLIYVKELTIKMTKLFKKRKNRNKGKQSTVNLIVTEGGNLDTIEKTLTFNPRLVNLETQYNDSFNTKVSGKGGMISLLKTKNKSGLHLLHSIPGTGKTTFIKWLMSQDLNDKEIFYISPDMASALTSPGFINFVIEEANNSILIIEDAESIIESRSSGSSDAVSNLLNLTDGILGDLINVQIICTFNTGKENIDEALLRPGRLLTDIMLDKLSAEKSDYLLKSLGKDARGEKMRICEIYNDDAVVDTKPTKIGFGN